MFNEIAPKETALEEILCRTELSDIPEMDLKSLTNLGFVAGRRLRRETRECRIRERSSCCSIIVSARGVVRDDTQSDDTHSDDTHRMVHTTMIHTG